MATMFSRRQYESRLFVSVEGRRFCRLNNVWMDVFYSWTYRWQPYAHISPLWPKTYRGAGCCPLPLASQYPLLVKTWGWNNGGIVQHPSPLLLLLLPTAYLQHLIPGTDNQLYTVLHQPESYTSLSPTPDWVLHPPAVLHQPEPYTSLIHFTVLFKPDPVLRRPGLPR